MPRIVPDRSTDWLSGFIADLPTPFDDNDTIDLTAFARLCERQICAGASAILIGETAGEAATLTPDERDALLRTAVTASRGRIRVVAGAGSNATSRAIELTLRAQEAGADAVMSVVPYYNRPTQAGIAAHFRAIAEATLLPIILHDTPRSARALSDEVLIDLMESRRFIGLKDATGDMARLARLRPLLPPTFRMLTGNDDTALPYLMLGGDGCFSTTANVVPQLCRGMHVACRQGQALYATTIMDKLAPLNEALPQDISASAVKYALSLRGLAGRRVRLPLVQLAETDRKPISDAIDRIWAIGNISPPKWQTG